MGIFGRRANEPTRSDPVLGPLVFDGKAAWKGKMAIRQGEPPVDITIMSGKEGPTSDHRIAFQELVQRYDTLLPLIAAELFRLYAPYLAADAEMRPRPSSAQEMGGVSRLDWIEIETPQRIRLGYGFAEGIGWDDAMFTVRLEDWRVSGERLDD